MTHFFLILLRVDCTFSPLVITDIQIFSDEIHAMNHLFLLMAHFLTIYHNFLCLLNVFFSANFLA